MKLLEVPDERYQKLSQRGSRMIAIKDSLNKPNEKLNEETLHGLIRSTTPVLTELLLLPERYDSAMNEVTNRDQEITQLTKERDASWGAFALRNFELDEAKKTITTLEKQPGPMNTEHPAHTHTDGTTCSIDHTQEYMKSITELNNKLLGAYTIMEAHKTAIKQLRHDLDEERIVTRSLAPNSGSSETRNDQKTSDPEKFGGDWNKLRSFLVQIRLKAATFSTTKAKLRFTVNCLKDDALDQVTPYVHDDQVNLADLSALIKMLETAFGNPNRIQDAERKLNTLQQGNRDVSSYFAQFSRYAAEVSLNEGAKLAALRQGLSGTLKRDLITTLENSQTVDQLVTICQQLDNRRRAVHQETGSSFGRTGGN